MGYMLLSVPQYFSGTLKQISLVKEGIQKLLQAAHTKCVLHIAIDIGHVYTIHQTNARKRLLQELISHCKKDGPPITILLCCPDMEYYKTWSEFCKTGISSSAHMESCRMKQFCSHIKNGMQLLLSFSQSIFQKGLRHKLVAQHLLIFQDKLIMLYMVAFNYYIQLMLHFCCTIILIQNIVPNELNWNINF